MEHSVVTPYSCHTCVMVFGWWIATSQGFVVVANVCGSNAGESTLAGEMPYIFLILDLLVR
jgi:hypothetical protein